MIIKNVIRVNKKIRNFFIFHVETKIVVYSRKLQKFQTFLNDNFAK